MSYQPSKKIRRKQKRECRKWKGIKWESYTRQRRIARALERIFRQMPEDWSKVRAVKLEERHWPCSFYIITRETYPHAIARGDLWRATRFDWLGPSGHFNGRTITDILASLNGERVPSIGLPHAAPGQFRFHSCR